MNTRNTLCIAALAFALITVACVPPSDPSASHITITVRGGEHVHIIKNSFTVPAGLTWAGILADADGCVNYDDRWEFSLWRIGNET